jgi:hypothetical protein
MSSCEIHRMLIEKVFPRQTEVMTVAEWVPTIKAPLTNSTATAALCQAAALAK